MGDSVPGNLSDGLSLSGPLVKCIISSLLGWMLRPFMWRCLRMGYVFCSLVMLADREEEVRSTPSSM